MFQTCIDQLVKVTLTNEEIKNTWVCGTLFVEGITESQAHKVFHRLSETLGLGKVQANYIGGGEYAFDFV